MKNVDTEAKIVDLKVLPRDIKKRIERTGDLSIEKNAIINIFFKSLFILYC